MFYDVNVNQKFPQQDMSWLEESGYSGVCVNTVVKPSFLKEYAFSPSPLHSCSGRGVYNRLEIEFCEGDVILYDQKRAMVSDVVAVRLGSAEGIDRLIKLQPDVITFDYCTQPLALKGGLVRTAVRMGIFFEITLREGYVDGGKSVMWMRNVRRLLSITNGRGIVVGSGAMCGIELRKPLDIIQMLRMFGLKRKRAEEVVQNAERLLKRCAMRRYCHKEAVVHCIDEGALKRDFVLSLYR